MLAVAVLAVIVLASAVNGVARWSAKRVAAGRATPEGRSEIARNNLLVIGVEGASAVGFLALKVEPDEERVWGIAIPAGAFMEVPGQGFERVGESLRAGPDVSEAAVSNYFGVPFERHVVVEQTVYRSALENQSAAGLIDAAESSDLEAGERERLRSAMQKAPSRDVGLVSLPVIPISLGDETYFEPQRDKIADLLKAWWGVEVTPEKQPVRVIVYNGSGVPGVAGTAAQRLIEHGYRVIDTRNADRFDYPKTQVIVQHGDDSVGDRVKSALGVGLVTRKESRQQIVDVIVIVGKDFAPKPKDG